jgi:serine/threonine protein kinase
MLPNTQDDGKTAGRSMGTDSLIGKTLHNDLLIKAKLGEGGMGAVYLAQNLYVHDMKHAVKVVRRELTHNASFQKRFFDEATHQSKLDHPNIVQVQNYFKEGDDYFLVLAFVDGPSVADIIDNKGGPLDQKQALSIIKETLNALNCAHENGILHRDVKPSNILVDKTGRARLTDFGIATEIGPKGEADRGRSIGTAEYMSPEQILTPSQIDHRADVYSAGIVLFEMLTGRLPFDGESADAIKHQQVETPAPDPRTYNRRIPKDLARIVLKAVEKDPDKRFQGCMQFRKAIEAYEHKGRRVFMALAVSALLLAGTYVAKVWFEPPAKDVAAIKARTDSATNDYALLCQESTRLLSKRRAIVIARESGNSDMEDLLARQVVEIDTNITKLANDFINQISGLQKFDRTAVRRVLAEGVDDVERARFLRRTSKNYEQFLSTRQPPSREAMLQACSE